MIETTIRRETDSDIDAVHRVNEVAFGQPGEAALVDALRENGADILSLVAERGGEVVGHILFSPAHVVSDDGEETDAVALAPIAVLPAHQRTGVGAALIEQGLTTLREAGHGLVIVLGHAAYYPRFGFVPASMFSIRCPFDVPDEAFMAMELRKGATPDGGGVVRYRPEFDGA
jgi:putative acetyltransferase